VKKATYLFLLLSSPHISLIASSTHELDLRFAPKAQSVYLSLVLSWVFGMPSGASSILRVP